METFPIEIWIMIVGLALVCVFNLMMMTEWSYLGTSFVRRSYDWMAPWYEGKWNSKEYQSIELNNELFLNPILELCADQPDARVLDLACGTGRVSMKLLQEPGFCGRIKAVDISNGMLKLFREHLTQLDPEQSEQAELLQQDLKTWKCEQPSSYDAVLFLEAAELIPHLPNLLAEVFDSLKPGGVLITTQVGHRFAWLFRGRYQQQGGMKKILAKNGIEVLGTFPWRKRYDVVIAKRPVNEFADLSSNSLVVSQ